MALRSPSVDTRIQAAKDLAGREHTCAATIDSLGAAAVDDEDPRAREAAIRSLGALGWHARESVPLLLSALDDEEQVVQDAAVWAIGQMGPLGRSGSYALLARVVDPYEEQPQWEDLWSLMCVDADMAMAALIMGLHGDGDDILQSLDFLGHIGSAAWPSSPFLLNHLVSDDRNAPSSQEPASPDVYVITSDARAARILAGFAINSEAVIPVLRGILRDKEADLDLRSAAMRALGELGVLARGAIPDLLLELRDGNSLVRADAAAALVAIHADADIVVPALAAAARTGNTGLRRAAISALGQYGPAGAAGVEEVVAALADSDSYVREGAARALGKMGAGGQESIEALSRSATDANARVREAAIRSLGQIGARASGTSPILTEALSDPDENVRATAALALGRVGSPDERTRGLLLDLYEKRTGSSSWNAATSLAKLGLMSEIVKRLMQDLRSAEPTHRWGAACALGEIGPEAKTSLGSLEELLGDDVAFVRSYALRALGAIAPRTDRTQRLAARMLFDDNAVVSTEARSVLVAGGAHAVPYLAGMMADPDYRVRLKSVHILARFANPEQAALILLQKARKDPSRLVQLTAEDAIARAKHLP